MATIELTERNFEGIVGGGGIVLVDFYAARLGDFLPNGRTTPIWYPLAGQEQRPCRWAELQAGERRPSRGRQPYCDPGSQRSYLGRRVSAPGN